MTNKKLTTKEAAKRLKCSERTVRDMIKRGSIYAEKIDPTTKSVYTIDSTEVEKILLLRKSNKPK